MMTGWSGSGCTARFRQRDRPEVERLLAAGEPVSAFDDLGNTPLHYAAEAGFVDLMRVLIAAGAEVDAHDPGVIGNTPLREVVGKVPAGGGAGAG